MNRIDAGDLSMSMIETCPFGSFQRETGYPKNIDILLIYDSNRPAEIYEYVDYKVISNGGCGTSGPRRRI